MARDFEVSIILSTYNRCTLLPKAIHSALAQDTDVHYEVVVVDNNSTDRTREVVESFVRNGHRNLRYVFEESQGVSNARNAGIATTAAPILAFFDDDECVAPDWVANISRIFRKHPEAGFIGGKVLPNWETEPPPWLTSSRSWGPVALVDYGDSAFYSNADNPICLITANLAVRREVFDRIGLFDTELQKSAGSTASIEDHELMIRAWRSGFEGLYVPELVVTADVPASRMTKDYHRRWHTAHGKYCAMIRFYELFDSAGRVLSSPLESPRLAGAPAFVYRDFLVNSLKLAASAARRREDYFQRELHFRHLAKYLYVSYRRNPDRRAVLHEIVQVAKQVFRAGTGRRKTS